VKAKAGAHAVANCCVARRLPRSGLGVTYSGHPITHPTHEPKGSKVLLVLSTLKKAGNSQ
jgi:hypothetical protein